MSPKQHQENLPGIEKFESVVRQIPGLNHIRRGYHTELRTSKTGPCVRMDLREHTLLLKCGNTEGWQELYAALPPNVDLNKIVAHALVLFPEHGITMSRRNIISLREKGVDLKAAQKRREEILQKRDEAREEVKQKEKEAEALTIKATLGRLGVPATPQTAEGKSVEETSPEETQPAEMQEFRNIPREEWPIVWPFLQEHARKEGTPTEGGWMAQKAFSILRDHPDIRMKKECANRFLNEAKVRGLVRRESNSFSWFISEKDWLETAEQEIVPGVLVAPPPSTQVAEEQPTQPQTSTDPAEILGAIIATLEKGENPLHLLQETLPLTEKPPEGLETRVEEAVRIQRERIEQARDLVLTHVEYTRKMQTIFRGEDADAAKEPSDENFAAGPPRLPS